MPKKITAAAADKLWGGISPDLRERVREAVAGVLRQRAAGQRVNGKLVSPGVTNVRALAGVKQAHVAALVRLYKKQLTPDPMERGSWAGARDPHNEPAAVDLGAEVEDLGGAVPAGSTPAAGVAPPREAAPPPAGAAPPARQGRPRKKSDELAAMIRAISTHQDAVRALIEAAGLAAEGELAKTQADAIKSLIGEARAHLKDERDAPKDTTDQVLFLSPSAVDVVRLWEGIVSDERRTRILEFLVAEFRADEIEHPGMDTGQTGQVEAVAG